MRRGSTPVIASGIFSGTIPVFATLLSSSGVNAFVQVFWRIVLGAPILVLFAAMVRRSGGHGGQTRLWNAMAFAGIGAILLALLLTYIGSISLGTPAATAVLLLYSQPIFTVLLSRVLLGEQVTWEKSIALLLGISGVLVVLNPLRLGLGVGVGQALAISSGLLYALYIIASKKVGGFNPMTKTALSFSGALALLFPAYWLIGLASPGIGVSAGVANINVTQVALLLGLVVIGTILPYVALNFGLEHMPASDSGLTLLVEPIVASALGSVFLGQGLGLNQLVGGALIVASILVLNRGTSTYLRGSASNRPRVLVVRPASQRSFAPGGRRPTLSVRRNDTNPTRPESRERTYHVGGLTCGRFRLSFAIMKIRYAEPRTMRTPPMYITKG